MYVRILGLIALLALASCSQSMARVPESTDAERIEEAQNSSDIVRFSKECQPWDDWEKPAKPFHIYGNTYYVGTCGIAAILVVSDSGHVLIDTGTEAGAELAVANIQALGFNLGDFKGISHSHEHFDHVGGFALVQAKTGAPIFAAPDASLTILTGRDNPRDPQVGMHKPMAENDLVEILTDPSDPAGGWGKEPSRFELSITDALLKAIRTPGHSPGALSWQWESCQNEICKTIVYADSLSPISRDDYKFSDHPEYLAAYREGIAKLRGLKCDILLTPHPSHSKMVERAATGTMEGGMSCAEYADSKIKALDERLAKEAGE